jgi:hypothetical protein
MKGNYDDEDDALLFTLNNPWRFKNTSVTRFTGLRCSPSSTSVVEKLTSMLVVVNYKRLLLSRESYLAVNFAKSRTFKRFGIKAV